MSTSARTEDAGATAATGDLPAAYDTASTPQLKELDGEALRGQLAETREEIGRVDAKASIVLAGAGVAIGVVIAGLIAGDLRVGKLALLVALLSGSSAFAALAGVACLGAAIYPRCGTADAGRARYFIEVATFENHDELRAALQRDAIAGDRLLHQLLGLSKAVASKYNHLRWGIRLLGLAILLATGSGILNLVLA